MGLLNRFSLDGKVGYKNENGDVVIKPLYDDGPYSFGRYDALGYHNEYCSVKLNDKFGILHQSGKLVIPCDYMDASPLFDDLFAIRKRFKDNSSAFGVMNSQGEIIIPFEFKAISSSGKFIKSFKEQNLQNSESEHQSIEEEIWYDCHGNLVYHGSAYRADGDFLITLKDLKLGLVDCNGNVLLNHDYDEIKCINSNCFIVRINDGEDWQVGVVQQKGQIVIPFEFKSIRCHDSLFFECFVESDSDYKYDLGLVKSYSYYAERNPRWFNPDGDIIHDGKGRVLSDNLLAVEKNGKWGVCNVNAERIVNLSYDDIRFFGGRILIRKDDCIGFLNPNGTVIIPPIYNSIESSCVSETVYTDRYERKTYGKYFDENPFSTLDSGQNIIRSEVHSCGGRERYDISYLHENYGKIDFTKIMILRTDSYAELFSVDEGILPNSRFDQIYHFSETNFAVAKNGLWGVYASDENKLIIPCEYQQIIYEGGDAVLLQKDNLWGAMTLYPPAIFCDVEIEPKFHEIKILNYLEETFFGVKLIETKFNGEECERYTIVDIKGEEVEGMYNFENLSSQFTYYGHNRILTSIENKYGFISLDGYCSIPFKYDEVVELSKDLFNVRIDKSWGLLSLDKGEVVPVKYKEPLPFNYANCIVVDSVSLKKGMLSESGSEKIPTIYDHLIHGFDDYRLTQYGKYILVGYGGDSESGMSFRFSGVDDALWGCMNEDGKTLVPVKYDCIKIVSDYILAGRDAELFTDYNLNHSSDYTGVYDLYDLSGTLLIGGFRTFEYIEEQGLFKFLFGGKWEHVCDLIDEWNDVYHEYNSFDNTNAKWLITDKELRAIKLTKDNEEYVFRKGSKITITKSKEEKRIVNYWNCSLDVLFKSCPTVAGQYLIAESGNQYYAIRLSDGKESTLYDEVKHICDNLFFVRLGDNVGIVDFYGNIILPINYVALTYPVCSYVFGVTEGKNGVCNVDLIVLNADCFQEYRAVSNARLSDVLSSMKYGIWGIYVRDDYAGLKSISVYRKHLFDKEFLELINPYQEENIHSKFSQCYWFSNHSALKIKQSYNDDRDEDNDEYMKDSWDAMTDGMYGDMPDGFDGDFSFLGR